MDSPGHPIHLCFQPMYLRACHVPGGCWRKGAAQLLPLGSSQPGLVPRLKGTLQAGSAGAPSWGLWGRDAEGAAKLLVLSYAGQPQGKEREVMQL